MKAIYRFNAISIKTPITFFLHTLQIIYMEPKKPKKQQKKNTQNCQSRPEDKEKSWRQNPSGYIIKLQ